MISVEVAGTIHQAAEEDAVKTITEEGWLASAKDQNFGTFFSRDALNCSKFRLYTFEKHPSRHELLVPIRSSLKTIAYNLGKEYNPLRDEEPGRPPHELRRYDSPKNTERLNELGAIGWPVGEEGMWYGGASDVAPLFVEVTCNYFLLTDDRQFFEELDPYIRKALWWIENHSASRGDGYIRYSAQNRNALLNQMWKDSFDAIEISPGKRPKEPIAVVEIQGYTYDAYVKAAEAYRRMGNIEFAKQLYQRAGILKNNFNRDFWMEDEGFYAFALDGDNNRVKEITSNVGHLLMSGIIDEAKEPIVVDRIMRPDIFTNWGLRPLSAKSTHFSDIEPFAYHRGGGIWPHDNGIIYMGLKKAGYVKEAGFVRDAVLNAQYGLFVRYGLINDELYMVDRNGNLRPYETSQHPQSWVTEANKMWTDPLEVNDLL